MRVLRRDATNAAPNAGSARVATCASGSAIAQDQQLAVLAVVVAAASREMRKINRARLSSGGGCNNSLVGALPLHTSESVSFIPRVTAPVFSARPLLKRTQVRVAELDPRRLHWQLDCLGVFVVQR